MDVLEQGNADMDSQSLLDHHERQEESMGRQGMFVVNGVTKEVHADEKVDMEVDLEEALDYAGVGKYQAFHLALMVVALVAAILEMIGNAFILPAAACDLHIPDTLKGLLTSVPNIGVILTAAVWGRLADALGRKKVLMWSSLAAGVIGLTAAAMPTLLGYALTKFVGSLFLACPSSLTFAYVGELTARRRRDLAVLLLSSLLNLFTVFSPVLAWIILAKDDNYNIGTLSIHPWRLLTVSYALPLVLAGLWMTQAMESPKYLVTKGRRQEALEVLRHIYAKNTGNAPDRFCVSSIKAPEESRGPRESVTDSEADLTHKVRSETALALLRPPHLRWFALISFLMFGVFSSLNGLFLFAPDTINKVMNEDSDVEGNICDLINMTHSNHTLFPDSYSKESFNVMAICRNRAQRLSVARIRAHAYKISDYYKVGSQATNPDDSCVDTMSHETFLIMVVTTLVYGVLVLVISVCPVSKKSLLVGMYATTGAACLLAGVLTNRMVAGAMMSALQLSALGIGPLTAYAVHLFPTTLRGTAVGACLMFGRLGSITGANVAGALLATACAPAFYGFSAILFLCLFLTFLLPKDEQLMPPAADDEQTSSSSDR